MLCKSSVDMDNWIHSENLWVENQKDISYELNVSCLKDGRRLLKEMFVQHLDSSLPEELKTAVKVMLRLFECIQLKMEVNPSDVDYLNLSDQNANPMLQEHMDKVGW